MGSLWSLIFCILVVFSRSFESCTCDFQIAWMLTVEGMVKSGVLHQKTCSRNNDYKWDGPKVSLGR